MTIRIAALALAGLGLLGLAACGEASAVETRERPMQAASLDGASGAEPMDAVAAAQPAEKPAVTSTRNETADAKVTRSPGNAPRTKIGLPSAARANPRPPGTTRSTWISP